MLRAKLQQLFIMMANRIAIWHHRACIADLEFEMRQYRSHLKSLPAAMYHCEQLQKFHMGRLDTLTNPRSRVNYRLGMGRVAMPSGARQAVASKLPPA